MNRRTIQVNLAAPWEIRNNSLIAPVIMLAQAIACGSAGCVLHPAETIKNSVNLWRNIPVTLNHPEINGRYLSAASPETAGQVIGHLESPAWEGGKLKARVVITRRDPGLWETLQRTREVSVGIFTEELPAQGIYEGREFTKISQFIRPDHLALLPEGGAAFSWEAGGGIRANTKGEREMSEILMPGNIRDDGEKMVTNEELRILQESEDILLPYTILNQNLAGQKRQDENDDALLPCGFGR